MTHKEVKTPLLSAANSSEAGPSQHPPTFQESAGDAVVVLDDVAGHAGHALSNRGEEPPAFAPYQAEHWVSNGGDGEIISHDSHLNEDGEALYRFLLSQTETPPTFIIHCRGSHSETRTRFVTRTDPQGQMRTETEYYTETVTDFDFKIIQPVLLHATQWTVADEEPAYRGRMSKEVGLPGDTTKADRSITKRFKAWREERERRGLPPWAGPNDDPSLWTSAVQHSQGMSGLKSSWTLRQWADDYCQSRNIFKEFVYEKIIYGWDLGTLESAIRAVIQSTRYNRHIQVSFKTQYGTVIVRPDRAISRATSNPCVKFLLIITLIYPCIWLFQRLYWHGGGRWRVGGSGYALKKGIGIGESEREWLQRWENSIRRSVIDRRVDNAGMIVPNWA